MFALISKNKSVGSSSVQVAQPQQKDKSQEGSKPKKEKEDKPKKLNKNISDSKVILDIPEKKEKQDKPKKQMNEGLRKYLEEKKKNKSTLDRLEAKPQGQRALHDNSKKPKEDKKPKKAKKEIIKDDDSEISFFEMD